MSAETLSPIILAAGSAQRMGRRPKCLLEIEGEALICRLVRASAAANMRKPVVVLGAYAQEVLHALRGLDVITVTNADLRADQTASLRLGLRATDADAQAVMVLLADQPLIGVSQLLSLIEAYQTRPEASCFVQPCVSGLPGNPVIFTAHVRDEILSNPPFFGAKQWANAHPEACYRWNTTHPHYRIDLDREDDIAQLRLRFGQSASWPREKDSKPA